MLSIKFSCSVYSQIHLLYLSLSYLLLLWRLFIAIISIVYVSKLKTSHEFHNTLQNYTNTDNNSIPQIPTSNPYLGDPPLDSCCAAYPHFSIFFLRRETHTACSSTEFASRSSSRAEFGSQLTLQGAISSSFFSRWSLCTLMRHPRIYGRGKR